MPMRSASKPNNTIAVSDQRDRARAAKPSTGHWTASSSDVRTIRMTPMAMMPHDRICGKITRPHAARGTHAKSQPERHTPDAERGKQQARQKILGKQRDSAPVTRHVRRRRVL